MSPLSCSTGATPEILRVMREGRCRRTRARAEGIMDFNKLWQNFLDTVQNHYMDFSGRVGRPQYWYFILVCFLVEIVAAIVGGILLALISPVVSLLLLLPVAGMS